jgi:hypothetical protein
MTALLLTIGIFSHIALVLVVAAAITKGVTRTTAGNIMLDLSFYTFLFGVIYFWVRFFGWPA